MVANPGKFHIIFLTWNIDNSKITFVIENRRVKSRSEVKQVDITIDDKMSLDMLKTYAAQQVTVCEL